MTLDLVSERYSASGSVTARMLTRAVRNSSLDDWAMLLRETLQNSVDARLDDLRTVCFRVGLQSATTTQRNTLRDKVLSDLPPFGVDLQHALDRPRLPLLLIADWHTRGLGGPTRADTPTDERADFRDFFLNVGREASRGYAGGTFGLGRGVLFDISDTGTIVTFTRTCADGRSVTRLMAMAIGDGFDGKRARFTGRHWWGRDAGGGRVEPVTGRDAERLARKLGMDVIPPDTTGTAILVISPRIPDDSTLEDALDEMKTAARLYGWPLVSAPGGRPTVEFQFALDGRPSPPLSPDALDSPVRRFAEAYRIATDPSSSRGPTSWHRTAITFGAGRATPVEMGVLAFRHLPPVPVDDTDEDDERLIQTAAIALMRKPRMVVRYLPVPPHPQGSTTVGVYVADDDFDHAYAESEPVAHDDWIPAKLGLQRNARNPVKQTLDKIRRAVRDSWRTQTGPPTGPDTPDVIAPVLSDMLGGLMTDTPGFSGPANEPQGGGGAKGAGGTGRPRSTRVRVGEPSLRSLPDGGIAAEFPVNVSARSPFGQVTLDANARVVTDGGLERDDQHPEGAAIPRVVGWEDREGTQLGTGGSLTLTAAGTESLRLIIGQPADTAITVDVRVRETGK